MYVRQLGWLHATPEGSKKTRLATFKSADENHPSLRLPEIEQEHAAGYLIGLLHEAGLMSSNGMGPVPLSWSEIESWIRCTELDLSLWERLTIKNLSEEYVGELSQATAKDRPAPFRHVEDEEEIDRSAVENKILSVLRGFNRKRAEDDNESKELT